MSDGPAQAESLSASQSMRTIVAWILDHRGIVLLAIAACTVAGAWLITSRAVLARRLGSCFCGVAPVREVFGICA